MQFILYSVRTRLSLVENIYDFVLKTKINPWIYKIKGVFGKTCFLTTNCFFVCVNFFLKNDYVFKFQNRLIKTLSLDKFRRCSTSERYCKCLFLCCYFFIIIIIAIVLMLMISVLDWILYYCKYAIDGWGIYVMVHRALVLSLKW